MKYFSRTLLVLLATLSCAIVSHAGDLVVVPDPTPTPLPTATPTPVPTPSVVIEDLLAPHAPITHLQQFSTTLTAHVDHAPQSHDEIQIAGPTYEWSGGTPIVKLSSNTGQSVGLSNDIPVAHDPVTLSDDDDHAIQYGLPGGQFTTSVTCTATYTQKNLSTGAMLTPIKYTAPKEVKFWVRVPVSLRSLDEDPIHGVSPTKDPTETQFDIYSHAPVFKFAVIDNQPVGEYYGYGKIHEKFDSYTPNPDYADSLEKTDANDPLAPKYKAPGLENTWPVGSTFSDQNGWNTYIWTDEDYFETDTKGPSDFWFSFGQTFICLEQALPHQEFDQKTTLVPSFTVKHLRDGVERK